LLNLKTVKFCTIHHSAVTPGARNIDELTARARSYDQYHKVKADKYSFPTKTKGEYGYSYISYHFMIARDGSWLQTQDEKYARYHASDNDRGENSHNLHGIAILIDGNFETEMPTDAQLKTAGNIIRMLEKKYKWNLNVEGHSKTALYYDKVNKVMYYPEKAGQAYTQCPGKHLLPLVKSKIVKYANNPSPVGVVKPKNETCKEKLENKEAQISSMIEQIKNLNNRVVTLKRQNEVLVSNKTVNEGRIDDLRKQLSKCREGQKNLKENQVRKRVESILKGILSKFR